jgi:hypothetical protein
MKASQFRTLLSTIMNTSPKKSPKNRKSFLLLNPKSSYSLLLLLLWLLGFATFHCWLLRRFPRDDDADANERNNVEWETQRTEGTRRAGDIRTILLESHASDDRANDDVGYEYDDDAPPSGYDRDEEEEMSPQFSDGEEPKYHADFSLGELRGEKRGKIAWLMR